VTVFGSDYDFSVSSNEIVKAALRTIGVMKAGDVPDEAIMANGREALNMMVKQWMAPANFKAPGLKMWVRNRATLTLTAKAEFIFKDSGGDLDIDPPVAIISASRRNSDNKDSLMTPMLLGEYEAIGDKTAEGSPTKYYYENQLDGGHFYLNHVPNDLTDTIRIVYLQPIKDVDAGTDAVDFSQEWFRALKYNLAVDLALENDKPITDGLMLLAADSLAQAQTFNPEEASIYFEPGKN